MTTQPPSAWKMIVLLGEELMRMASLSAQRDLIIETTASILGERADLWLDERLFRLPGHPPSEVFPPQPLSGLLMRAVSTGLPASPGGQKTLLAVPLKNGGLMIGALQVERPVLPFRKKERELLESLAGHIALALVASHRFVIEQWRIEQLTLVRRVSAQIAIVFDLEVLTRRVTKLIQQTFLPEHLPDIAGWNLAATWITARQVGGDFYDVIELPGGRLGLFIADVSDKDIPAALFMALTRTLVRAVVYDTFSPAEAMRRVNALIIPDNQQEMFVTAVYGVLTLESGEFTYTNAGHNPPITVCGKNRKIEFLRRTGAALGIIEGVSMEERTIMLEPDDFLLLYTDGLTEAFSLEGETYGDERLQQKLEITEEETARGILDVLEKSVRRFMGSLSPADDLTMLGVRRMV